MKKLIPLTLLLLLAGGARAQLRSTGDVPADLKMSVQELYDSDLQRAKKYAGGRVKNKQQVLEASYNINKLMAGGHIVYGDPISHLAGRIADTLLKDYPELRSELRFYTVTSPEVNAFATGQGMVFINAGLVAQVEDEAQLAFIISHEIIHYYRSHSMEKLVGKKKKKDKKQEADYGEADSEVGDFIRRHNRSREMESEADSLGIAMFYLQSPYDKNVTDGVFDVLQYSELPFDEIPFDTTWFNTPYFSLTGCWLDTVANITSRDNYDDSRSTHPNIISRRRNCTAALDGYYGGERFVMTTEKEFDALRQLARMECIRQETIHGQYARAFYNTWLMAIDTVHDIDRYTVDHLIAQELYGLAKFKNHELTKEAVGDYKEVEGESQQVYYAMHEMSPEHANLIALHKVWEMHRRYPNDESLTAMAADLMEELRTANKKSVIDFVATAPADTDADEPKATQEQDDRPKTKYERIKQKRETQAKRNPTSYALTDLMATDADFASALRNHLNDNAPAKPEITPAAKDSSAIIIFNPTYWVIDNNSEEQKIMKSDQGERDLTARMMRTGRHFGRESVDLSDAGMRMMDSDTQYNDFLTMCEWSNEFWLNRGDFSMQRLMQPAMDSLLDRYDARTVNFTVLLNVEGTRADASPGYLIALPFAPLVAAGMFSGIEHTALASVIVDAKEGKVLSREAYSYNVADHPDMVDGMLYDTYVRAMRPKTKDPSGYMGKHFALMGGYNLGFAGYQTFKAGHYAAFTPWAAIEVALKRNLSLSVWGRYHKGYEDVTVTKDTTWTTPTSYGYNYNWGTVEVPSSKKMLMVGVTIHNFKRSDFAPFGFYMDYGLHMVRFTNLDNTPSGYTFGAHIGVGRNYVFFKYLLLNWEVDYAYTYGIHKTIDFDFTDKYKNYLHYADAIMSNIVTIRLGIGLLPF